MLILVKIIMEEVNFYWVLQALSQQECIIPILDTIFFKDDRVLAHFVMSDRILTKQVPTDSVLFSSTLNLLITQNSLRSKIRKASDIICYAITKNERLLLTLSDLKDLQKSVSLTNRPRILQISKPQFFNKHQILLYKLVSSSEGYVSSLYSKHYKTLTACNSRDFYDKAKDIGKLLLMYIEQAKGSKVLTLSIELISDNDFQLWLAGITECKIIDIGEANLYHISSAKDLQTIPLKKRSFTNTVHTSLKKHSYRIENTRLPIIITPTLNDTFEDQDEEIGKPKIDKPEISENLLLVRRNSMLKKEPKRKEIENNERFRDFIEILSKTFVKFQEKSTGVMATDEDLQKESKRINGILNPEISDNSRHPSMCSNEISHPKSPILKRKIIHRPVFFSNSKSNPSSRKNSDIFYSHGIHVKTKTKNRINFEHLDVNLIRT